MKKNFLETVKTKGIAARAALCGAALAIQNTVMSGVLMAANEANSYKGSTEFNEDLQAGGVLSTIMDIAVTALALFGGVFVLIGAFKFFMALKNDQPEQQAGAIRELVIGAVIVAFRIFAWKPIGSMLFK